MGNYYESAISMAPTLRHWMELVKEYSDVGLEYEIAIMVCIYWEIIA